MAGADRHRVAKRANISASEMACRAIVEALERDEGMTLPELRDVMERQMLVGQVRQIEILGRVSITDTESRERAVSEYMNTLRNEAIIDWEDEGAESLYDEFLANRPGA